MSIVNPLFQSSISGAAESQEGASPRSSVTPAVSSIKAEQRRGKFHSTTAHGFRNTGMSNSKMSPLSMLNQSHQGAKQSSMLEQEMKAIEKIKAKQKKEVEQMIDYEMQLSKIKQRNEERQEQMRQKEVRRQAELARIRKE
jgi:hypothetical protein